MKNLFTKPVLLLHLLFMFTGTFLSAQTLVNQEWVTTVGSPNYHIDYMNAILKNGYYYFVGNQYNSALGSQLDNYLIAKVNADDGIKATTA